MSIVVQIFILFTCLDIRAGLSGNLNNPYVVDITEITDFDNLHHAEGIIKENQDWQQNYIV